jgi:hypothetical protein
MPSKAAPTNPMACTLRVKCSFWTTSPCSKHSINYQHKKQNKKIRCTIRIIYLLGADYKFHNDPVHTSLKGTIVTQGFRVVLTLQ